jgi:hypothetical protein
MVATLDALLAVPGLNLESKAGQDYVGIKKQLAGDELSEDRGYKAPRASGVQDTKWPPRTTATLLPAQLRGDRECSAENWSG